MRPAQWLARSVLATWRFSRFTLFEGGGNYFLLGHDVCHPSFTLSREIINKGEIMKKFKIKFNRKTVAFLSIVCFLIIFMLQENPGVLGLWLQFIDFGLIALFDEAEMMV